MFDFSFGELMLVGVIALVVLGPERLPKVARTAGQLVGRVQRMVSSVKTELSAQLEMDELKKAKSEFESAATQFRDEMRSVGESAQHEADEIAKGLDVPAWERVPEQRTPADFGVDELGRPLPTQESDKDRAWRDYLMPPEKASVPAGAHGFQTASLKKQAMQRKRDMRPRHRPKPQLRVRKK
ncbi:MAG: Sec-independent protein translocase protein TatB [Neisseria sp.]|nr:Sec-independent protein translocase protein TatB [Neisseria sp.]